VKRRDGKELTAPAVAKEIKSSLPFMGRARVGNRGGLVDSVGVIETSPP
jgi:hypothetical protein